LALTKAQSEKRKVKSESAKRKRVLTPSVVYRVLWAIFHPLTLTTSSGGFKAEVCMGRVPCPSANQSCQG